jgi:hypothetical protein
MDKKNPYPDDRTAPERRKKLTEKQIEDLELAGGVEGGMQAGSAGPRESDAKTPSDGKARETAR